MNNRFSRYPFFLRSSTFFLFPFTLLSFVLLCTLNSAGYRYGASDLAFYVPAVLERLDPALFPRDGALIASQARLTMIDEIVATLARVTGLALPALLAALYCVTLAGLLAGALLIAQRLYRSRWTAAALAAALTLKHAIAKSGTNTLEGYFHPRQLAFSLGTLALAALLWRRHALAAALVALAGLLHPTTALWFALWIGVAMAVNDARLRIPLAASAALAAVIGAWLLTAGPLAGRLTIMDGEWLATLVTKDYLFPLDWPPYAWFLNLIAPAVIAIVYRCRRHAAQLEPGERGLVWGCLSLLIVFAAALPLNAARLAIVIQLQIPRVFWMLDFLGTVYAVWALAEWRTVDRRRARLTFAVILLMSVARSAYILAVRFPERAVAEIAIADTDWGRVMAWARTTPRDTSWLAHPLHAVHYGTSLRVAGQRDVFVEGIKDAAIGMYERDVAIRTRDRLAELDTFDAMTPEEARSLAARHGIDYLVTEQPLALPIAFSSGVLRVYRLR